MGTICKKCGDTKDDVEFYEVRKKICKQCWRTQVYARVAKLREEGKCLNCAEPVSPGPLCNSCKKTNLDRYYENKEIYLSKAKDRRQRLKREAFAAYGGAICACCGETSIEFLTLDHIAGDGAAHRKRVTEERGWTSRSQSFSGTHLYLWLKQNNYPPGFQVLCMNCNFSMGKYGYCPHNKVSLSAVG